MSLDKLRRISFKADSDSGAPEAPDQESTDAFVQFVKHQRGRPVAQGDGDVPEKKPAPAPPERKAGTLGDFDQSTYEQALETARRTGRPILMVFGRQGTTETEKYNQEILKQAREKHGSTAVILKIDTNSDAGRRLAAKHAARLNEPYTMILAWQKDAYNRPYIDEVGPRHVGSYAPFVLPHIDTHLRHARSLMDRSGFPLKSDSEEGSKQPKAKVERQGSGEEKSKRVEKQPPQKDETDKKSERKKPPEISKQADKDGLGGTEELRPGVTFDKLGRATLFVNANKTVVRYIYEGNSKEPKTIDIDGVEWRPGYNGFDKYEKGVYKGTFPGTMGPDPETGEFRFKSNGGNWTKWTVRGGQEVYDADGASLEKNKDGSRIVKVRRTDGTVAESPEPNKIVDQVKGADGKIQILVWTKDEKNQWTCGDLPGEARKDMRLTAEKQLRWQGADGHLFTARRDGSVEDLDPKDQSAVVTKHGKTKSILFPDKTLREFDSKIVDGKEVLTGVTVTFPDKSTSIWRQVGEKRWTVNGKDAGNYHFEFGPNKEYIFHDLDKNLRIERTRHGQEKRIQKTSGGEERIYLTDEKGNVNSVDDPVSKRKWVKDGSVWRCGSEVRSGDLEILKEGFAFVDSKAGTKFVFTDAGKEEFYKGDKLLARYEKGKVVESLSEDGKTRRLFKWDGDTMTEEKIIRPNQEIVYTLQKDQDSYTNLWKGKLNGTIDLPDRRGNGSFLANNDYLFNHTDGTVHVAHTSGTEIIENQRIGYRAEYQAGALDLTRFPDGTLRRWRWKDGKENVDLDGFTVKTSQTTEYKWQNVGVDKWSVDGKPARNARITMAPDLVYTFDDFDEKTKHIRMIQGTTIETTKDKCVVESGRHGIDKVTTPKNEVVQVVRDAKGKITSLEELANGKLVNQWKWDEMRGFYVDGRGNPRMGLLSLDEKGAYTFTRDDGIRHIKRPGQAEEKRGTLDDLRRLAESQSNDKAAVAEFMARAEAFDKRAKAGNLSRKQIGDAYHRASEKILNGDPTATAAERLKAAGRLLEVKPSYERLAEVTDGFAGHVETALLDIPQVIRNEMDRKGWKFVAAQTVPQALPNLTDKPRGWGPNSSWANVGGVADSSTKKMVIAEWRRDQYRNNQWEQRTEAARIQGVTKHEFGHGFDSVLGSFSHGDAFTKAYRSDLAKMKKLDNYADLRRHLGYYLVKENDKDAASQSSEDAAKEELFAEIFSYIHGGESIEGNRARIAQAFPEAIKAVKAKLREWSPDDPRYKA